VVRQVQAWAEEGNHHELRKVDTKNTKCGRFCKL